MLRNEFGLTAKQENFARAVVETGSLTVAYRQAFNAEKMKPETVHKRAYELSGKGEIKARVTELLAEKQAKEQWNRERALSFAQERLIEEVTRAKDARDRLRALELFGNLAEFDLFTARKHDRTVRHISQQEAHQNLKNAIERALAWRAPPRDGRPN